MHQVKLPQSPLSSHTPLLKYRTTCYPPAHNLYLDTPPNTHTHVAASIKARMLPVKACLICRQQQITWVKYPVAPLLAFSFVVFKIALVCWRVVSKHPFAGALKLMRAFLHVAAFWISPAQEWTCPTCDHIIAWAGSCASAWCGRLGPRSCPRLLTRFPALPQRLVKVMASVKIKEMHAAFMSFLWLFPLSFGSLPPPPPPLSVSALLSPSPAVTVKVLCDT